MADSEFEVPASFLEMALAGRWAPGAFRWRHVKNIMPNTTLFQAQAAAPESDGTTLRNRRFFIYSDADCQLTIWRADGTSLFRTIVSGTASGFQGVAAYVNAVSGSASGYFAYDDAQDIPNISLAKSLPWRVDHGFAMPPVFTSDEPRLVRLCIDSALAVPVIFKTDMQYEDEITLLGPGTIKDAAVDPFCVDIVCKTLSASIREPQSGDTPLPANLKTVKGRYWVE
jgi:hypothetical protein